MISIKYSSYVAKFSDTEMEEVFCFYPNGTWDEDKLLLSEAEKKYPQDKYYWVKIDEDE